MMTTTACCNYYATSKNSNKKALLLLGLLMSVYFSIKKLLFYVNTLNHNPLNVELNTSQSKATTKGRMLNTIEKISQKFSCPKSQFTFIYLLIYNLFL